MSKSSSGRFFEDFVPGAILYHAIPHTVTAGDQTLYAALYGSRFALNQSETFATQAGYPAMPLDDLFVFHLIFGQTVADVSVNAVANLGYADCRFLQPVFVGDTLTAVSEIVGLKANSDGKTGIVYVHSKGTNQRGEPILDFVRWVMINRRAKGAGAEMPVRALPDTVDARELGASCPRIHSKAWDNRLSGSENRYSDYSPREQIDHVDGVTIEESEHMMATRLYHNTAKVHFNALAESSGRFGRRIVYGGHVMSVARSLSYNGLANAFHIGAINGGRHVAPVFAGDTLHAWSEIMDKAELPGRTDVGAIRILTRAVKNVAASGFPATAAHADRPGVVLELDYWALIPR